MKLHHADSAVRLGSPLSEASAAIILIHGRGSSAEGIVGIARSLDAKNCAFLAPSATLGTWYPRRFLEPLLHNEPWLTSALDVVDQLVKEATAAGISSDRIGLVGFSQGACLSLEYAARFPRRYALIGGLSGALIGPLDTVRPSGDLKGTPILLGCAEWDAHIPIEFVRKSAEVLTQLGADVTQQIYPGTAHTVFPEEIEWLNSKLSSEMS